MVENNQWDRHLRNGSPLYNWLRPATPRKWDSPVLFTGIGTAQHFPITFPKPDIESNQTNGQMQKVAGFPDAEALILVLEDADFGGSYATN